MAKGSLLNVGYLVSDSGRGVGQKDKVKSKKILKYTKSQSNFIKYNILFNQLYTLRLSKIL